MLDGEYRSRWGLFRWHGSHDVSHREPLGQHRQARRRPGPASRALEKPRPTAEGGVGQVASPPARYVQYRATFGAAEGRLAAVTLAYLPQNQRARITELGVGGQRRRARPGDRRPGRARGERAGARGRRARTSRCSSCAGRSRTPTATSSNYRLAFREESDAVWRPLGGPDPLTKTDYDWNTEGLPDGTYVVRVTASDERSEPRERALDTTLHVGADPGRQPQAGGRRAWP